MDPGVPQSPFPPGFAPKTTDEPTPGTEPEEPRLGIFHFLVWTACVAVYLGVTGPFFRVLARQPSLSPGQLASSVITGIVSGTALGGGLLFLARRLRRLPFPIHPGEYLLVVKAFGAAMGLLFALAMLPLVSRMAAGGRSDFGMNWHFGILYLLGLVLLALVWLWVWLWALRGVKARRWRVYFVATIGAEVLPIIVLPAAGFLLGWRSLDRLLWQGIPATLVVAVGGLLAAVVLRDHFEGKRYPWTHWLGVAIVLTSTLVQATSEIAAIVQGAPS